MDGWIVYSLKYDDFEDCVEICEFDADIMPCHAAIDEEDICVSKSKDKIYEIAKALYPDKKIEFIPWGDDEIFENEEE